MAASSLASPARPNGPQPILKARKSAGAVLRHHVPHGRRVVHQERAVRPHAAAVSAAEQPANRLARDLAEDVPQRDVDAADGVRERAAAAHPEGVLAQLLGDPLGLKRVLAREQGLQHAERGLDQRTRGEHAAVAGDAGRGVHGDQRVDRLLGPDFLGPAALRAFAHQRRGDDLADAHLGGGRRAGRHGSLPLVVGRSA